MAGGFPLKRWQVAAVDDAGVVALAAELGLARPVALALWSRGLQQAETARAYLQPRLSDLSDPFLLPGVELAVARMWRAIVQREPVLIFGDYDVDGVSSAALLTLVLRRLGASVAVFLPLRLEDGYGMTREAVRQCVAEHRPRVLISVDCGITAHEAIAEANTLGVDVIVTDHHEPDGRVPPALAVVNPKLGGGEAVRMLSGTGVVFKLCHGLLKWGIREGLVESGRVDLREYLDIVALGTVADVVPLTGENRILARHGLKRLADAPRVGIRSLMDVAGINAKRIQAYHIGFGLGPRLNAAGRMGSAQAALQLLLTEDPDEARRLALQLDQANQERKRVEDLLYKQIVQGLEISFSAEDVFGLVVGGRQWHLGTVGIVAARLVRRYARPAVVIGFDETGVGRGSCRSIEDLDVLAVLSHCGELLEGYGGHTMAAGVSIREGHLGAFQQRFNQTCRELLGGRDLRPVQAIDGWIGLAEADRDVLDGLAGMEPFGMGNPTPTFGVRQLRLDTVPRKIGKDAQHLRFSMVQGGSRMEGVGFNLGAYAIPKGELDVVGQLQENDFRGVVKVELQVKDLAASGSTAG